MQNRKAFTMVELVFVIVVIGILSAVAIPKLAATRDDAEITKARTTLSSVRNAIATERQKRILRGNFTAITDLGAGGVGNAFDVFNAASDETTGQRVLEYPVPACSSNTATSCWDRVDGTHYEYRLPLGGTADFILQNNRLDCNADSADCSILGA